MISYWLILITSSGLKAASACLAAEPPLRCHDQECGTTPRQEAARLETAVYSAVSQTEVHMKRVGWFVAGVASAAGAVAAGAAVRARRHRDDDTVSAVAAVTVEEVDDVTEAVVPPPPKDPAIDAMRDQIGDARMRLREKAEAGVPEPSGGA
jgi:hypothetical protein